MKDLQGGALFVLHQSVALLQGFEEALTMSFPTQCLSGNQRQTTLPINLYRVIQMLWRRKKQQPNFSDTSCRQLTTTTGAIISITKQGDC